MKIRIDSNEKDDTLAEENKFFLKGSLCMNLHVRPCL